MSTYIQVYGRFRPSTSSGTSAIELLDTNRVRLQQTGKVFELHRIFAETSTQQEVFEAVAKKLVNDAAEGVNATVFAYGQTGSGKTHTMLGPGDGWSDSDTKGLIPRSIAHLFENLEQKSKECQRFKYTVSLEFVELYNETIFDLLDEKQKKISLRDTGSEVQLVGAISEQVDNYLDLMHVVKRGWIARRTGETAMNRDSSRSHAMIIVKVQTEELMGTMMITRKSTLNLVDLAGSERQSHTKAAGERLKEATHINGSLSVLGRCIRILSKPSDTKMMVPYRESPLTHILKNSLGGNSKTAVIVNMHPDQKFLTETSSTLGFASACAMIKNTVSKNEQMTGESEAAYKEAIRQLKAENEEIEEKVKKDFTEKLVSCEEEKNKLHELNITLRKGLQDIRSKYRQLVWKQNSDVDETLPEEVLKRLCVDTSKSVEDVTMEELNEKIRTLEMENEAKDREIEVMKADFAEQRANMTLSLNTTRTPQSNRRRTRDPRRETIYQPSPARRAVFTDENEPEVTADPSTSHIDCLAKNQELERTLEETKSKMSRLADEMVVREKDSTSVLNKAEQDCYALKEQLGKSNSECLELKKKLENWGKKFENLQEECRLKDQALLLAKEKQQRDALENTELNDTLSYYQKENKDLKNKNKALMEEIRVLKCVKNENVLLKQENDETKSENTLKSSKSNEWFDQKFEKMKNTFKTNEAEPVKRTKKVSKKRQQVLDEEENDEPTVMLEKKVQALQLTNEEDPSINVNKRRTLRPRK